MSGLVRGDITFTIDRAAVRVIAVSNPSTAYCTEPASWPAVAGALERAALVAPVGFTLVCVFRLNVGCGAKNLVKVGVFECAVCGAELEAEYNCQS